MYNMLHIVLKHIIIHRNIVAFIMNHNIPCMLMKVTHLLFFFLHVFLSLSATTSTITKMVTASSTMAAGMAIPTMKMIDVVPPVPVVYTEMKKTNHVALSCTSDLAILCAKFL